MLHLSGTTNVARTTYIGPIVGDNPTVLAYQAACATAGVAGVAYFTLYWQDPYIGAQSVTLGPLSLLSVGNSQYTCVPINLASGYTVDYSVTLVGVLGTPKYDIQILMASAS